MKKAHLNHYYFDEGHGYEIFQADNAGEGIAGVFAELNHETGIPDPDSSGAAALNKAGVY